MTLFEVILCVNIRNGWTVMLRQAIVVLIVQEK